RKLHFISDNVGFASTGDLVMTTDGGLTWNIVSDTTNGSMNWYISDICFPSANIGYISGLNGLLAKTTDGGLTWSDLSISDSNYIYGIDFLNPNFGVILNSEKNILRTDDGGINWTADSTGYLMSKCKMIDHSTVVAVGANGIIIKTTTLNINQATKSNHSIVLYPNPTNEIITVNLKNTEDEVKVRLHSSLGKVILSNQYFNTDNIKISILQEPGIYILEVILTNSKYSFKVIKK
ncbi:MAG: YCF48-related protein, partial [Parvicellaceae bacterium]